MSIPRDLGHGHMMSLGSDVKSGRRYFVDSHTSRKTGKRCVGSGEIVEPGHEADAEDPASFWVIEQVDPLTLSRVRRGVEHR
jgi:hypothetical protein